MNSYDILYGMDYIDTDLINKALNYGKKRRMYGIIKGLSVACLAVAVFVTGVNVQKKYLLNQSDEIFKYGMIPVKNGSDGFLNTTEGYPLPPYDFMDLITKNNGVSLVYGTAKNVKTYTVTKENTVWYIMIFDIEIIKSFNDAPETGSIKAVAVGYTNDGSIMYHNISKGVDIINNPTSMFVLYNDNISDYWHTIGDTEIKTFEIADYFLSNQCRTDENGAKISYHYFTFDEIEYYCKNGLPEKTEDIWEF